MCYCKIWPLWCAIDNFRIKYNLFQPLGVLETKSGWVFVCRIAFMFIVLFGTVSCSENLDRTVAPADPRFRIDPDLERVNWDVSLLDSDLRRGKIVFCEEPWYVDQVKDDPFLRSMAETEIALCKIFSGALKGSSEAFEEIRKTQKLPSISYAFSFFVENYSENDNLYFSEKEIGLFLTLESCQKVEAIARYHNVPTRACYQWNIFDHL